MEWNETWIEIGMRMGQERDENDKEIKEKEQAKGKARQRNTKRSKWAVGERGERMGIVIGSGMGIGMGKG